MKEFPRLILASGSPRRQQLLRSVGLSFEVCVTDVDETPEAGLQPAQIVESLSVRKAESAFEKLKSSYQNFGIVAADTIVVLDREVLGKPSDFAEAKEILSKLSGRAHQVFTGYAILLFEAERQVKSCVRHFVSSVKFKTLSAAEIDAYVATKEPMDKAGAYGIQEVGAFLVETIEGSYTNVVGLPLSQVVQDLQSFGVWIPQMLNSAR